MMISHDVGLQGTGLSFLLDWVLTFILGFIDFYFFFLRATILTDVMSSNLIIYYY